MISDLLIKALSGQLNPLESEQLKIELSALDRVSQTVGNWIGNDGWPSLQWFYAKSGSFSLMPTGGAQFWFNFTDSGSSSLSVPAGGVASVIFGKSVDSQFFRLRDAQSTDIDTVDSPSLLNRVILCYGNISVASISSGTVTVSLGVYDLDETLINRFALVVVGSPISNYISWAAPFSPSLSGITQTKYVLRLDVSSSVDETVFKANCGLAVLL